MEMGNEVNYQSNEEVDEIQAFSDFFELLSKIDNRLKNEDSDYRNKYYFDQNTL